MQRHNTHTSTFLLHSLSPSPPTPHTYLSHDGVHQNVLHIRVSHGLGLTLLELLLTRLTCGRGAKHNTQHTCTCTRGESSQSVQERSHTLHVNCLQAPQWSVLTEDDQHRQPASTTPCMHMHMVLPSRLLPLPPSTPTNPPPPPPHTPTPPPPPHNTTYSAPPPNPPPTMCQPVNGLQAAHQSVLELLVVRLRLEPSLIGGQCPLIVLHKVLQCALAAVALDKVGRQLYAPGGSRAAGVGGWGREVKGGGVCV